MTNLIALPSGTELVGDYRIDRVLGAGGFGVTYLADEMALGRLVTIKEYFPSDIAARAGGIEAAPRSQDCAGDYRWGLDRFIEEAQTLAKFDHRNIVRVYRYFRANNTGYMVLHWEEGQSLKNWLKSLGRAPRQKELDDILAPLLEALEFIHKADFLHRDIAPDNIIIRKSGDPVLIDFGSARGEIASHTKTVSALVKPGYSPYEQYAETSRQQGPWTDIYALGATLYHAITGKRPPDAPSRMVKDELIPVKDGALASYRAGFLQAIDRALLLSIEARPQSIAAWRGDLLAPDTPRTGWITRALDKKKSKAPAAANDDAKTVPPASPQAMPVPDAPAPKGSMLDFLDSLRKPAGAVDRTNPPALAAAEPVLEPALPAPAPAPAPALTPAGGIFAPGPLLGRPRAKPQPAEAKTVRMDPLPPLPAKPRKPRKEPAAKKATAAKGRALVAVKKPPQPVPIARPSAFRMTPWRWASLGMKLLIGVGVASAAVALQERLPKTGARGGAVALSQSADPSRATEPVADLAAHKGPVSGLAYSGDGRWIVTAGDDATLKVWDATYHKLIRAIELDDGKATSLSVTGSRAITGHANGRVVIWDLERGNKIAEVQRNEANVWAAVFTGDGSHIAAASHDWKIALWDLARPGMPLQVFDGHTNAVQALAYASRDALLASGGADQTVRLWDLKTLSLKRTYAGHRDFVTSVAFSPSGRIIASGALDGRIRLWTTLSSRRLRSLNGHKGRIGSIDFAPTGNLVASASDDGTVRLWDLRRGRTVRVLTGHPSGATKVAFSPDGQHLATAAANGVVHLWELPLAQLAKQ
jgi:serine/threonine protein kinase